MNNIETHILEHVTFDDFNPERYIYDDERHFLVHQGSLARSGLVRYLGFAAPLRHDGHADTRAVVQPVIDIDELPESARNIGVLGKGTGLRVYNTPEAATGRPGTRSMLGAFVFELAEDPFDLRLTGPARSLYSIRHGWRIARTQVQGLNAVVNSINSQFGDAVAVRYTQPYAAMLRQAGPHGDTGRSGVPGEFLLLRDPTVSLRRVGTYVPGD